MIFYESPYRVVKTLKQFTEYYGPDRKVCACREISKIHEENVYGTLAEVTAHFEQTLQKVSSSLSLREKKKKKIKEDKI